ncbi:MAG: hypothetical protein Q9188_004442 [Gyalolechia gomerana]
MPPTTPHPNNKHKSSAMTNSQKGKSTAQTSTKSKTTLLNDETEPPTRKFGNQALSYEEREERDRTVAMLRSWEMCAVMGEEDAESVPQTRLRLQKRLIGIEGDAPLDEGEDNDTRSDRKHTESTESCRRHEDGRKRPPASVDRGTGKKVSSAGGHHHGGYGHHS